jgi:hypothetical protein
VFSSAIDSTFANRELRVNLRVWIFATISLVVFTDACKSRGFRSVQSSEPLKQNSPFVPSDLSVIFPSAGLRQGSQLGSMTQDFDAAVFGRPATLQQDLEADPAKLEQLLELGFWPRLLKDGLASESVAKANGFLSQQDFNDLVSLVDPAKSGRNKDGGPFILQAQKITPLMPSNSEIKGKQWNVAPDKSLDLITTDVRDPSKWRVVSFRFDPCPYGLVHKQNLVKLKPEDLNCRPELRVVAQPMLGTTPDESMLAQALPNGDVESRTPYDRKPLWLRSGMLPLQTTHQGFFFADYAIHLFFRLSAEEAQEFVSSLGRVLSRPENDCGVQTAQLGVHPCLARQFMSVGDKVSLSNLFLKKDTSGFTFDDEFKTEFANHFDSWKNIDFAKSYGSLVQKMTKEPYKAAIFLSSNSADPWIFHLAERNKDKKFELKRIVSLETDRTDAAVGSENMSLYKSGKIQIIPRGAAVKGMFNIKDQFKQRIFPSTLPHLDSIDMFTRATSGAQMESTYMTLYNRNIKPLGLENITVTKDRRSDLLQLSNRVLNPFINDEFSTDCASCHLAGAEKSLLGSRGLPVGWQELGDTAPKIPVQFQPLIEKHGDEAKLADKNEWYRNGLNQLFVSPYLPGNSVPVEYRSLFDQPTDTTFVFNQFSIYRSKPIIGERVANETEVATFLTNRDYLGLEGGTGLKCDQTWLRACLDAYNYDKNWVRAATVFKRCSDPAAGICKNR